MLRLLIGFICLGLSFYLQAESSLDEPPVIASSVNKEPEQPNGTTPIKAESGAYSIKISPEGLIELHHIKAEDLIPQLKPFLSAGDKVQGSGYFLRIEANPVDLALLLKLIEKLDKPQASFEISVRQGADTGLDDEGGQVYGVSSRNEAGNAQSLQVLNGARAFISLSNDSPVISAVSGGILAPGVSYENRQLNQGFYVKPILEGDAVKLFIRRVLERQDSANSNASEAQNLETTTMVPLNTWVKLSSAGQSDTQAPDSGTTYTAANSFNNQSSLYIKIRRLE